MRYFVTGTTGYIGGEVARQLIAQGHEVVTIARNPDKAEDLRAIGVEVHRGDITEKDSMRAPMTGADGVHHIAGWYKVGVGPKDLPVGRAINVDGTRNVLELMRELAIPKGVYTSTLAVNSDTEGREVDETYHYDGSRGFLSFYDQTKWEAHVNVAAPMIRDGLPLVIVMPGLVYGPDDPSNAGTTLRQYLLGKLPVVPLQTAFSWGHLEDVAAAHLLAMEKGRAGESYMICGETMPFVDAMKIAVAHTGIPLPMTVSPSMMKFTSRIAKLFDNVFDLPPTFKSETMRVSAGVTYIGSNAKARRELGYAPRALSEGLPPVIDHEMKKLGVTKRK